MSAMEEALQSASKFYSNKWVVDEVPDTVIEHNELYYTFIAVLYYTFILTNTLLMR